MSDALNDALRDAVLAGVRALPGPGLLGALPSLRVDEILPGPRSDEVSLYGSEGGERFVATVKIFVRRKPGGAG